MLTVTAGTRLRVPETGHLYDVLHSAGALVQLATGIFVNGEGQRETWPVYGINVTDADGTDWIEVEIADLAARAEAEAAAECARLAAASSWVDDEIPY